MTIQFLGQSCFLFTIEGKTILADPFYNYGKEKSNFKIQNQKIDYILITHAHQDHVADVKEVLKHHPNVTIIAQPEICGYFQHTNNLDINIGGTADLEVCKIKMVNALHTSSFSDGSYGGVASGYILSYLDQNIYLAGDTGVMAEMDYFPVLYGPINLAILPIGGHYTMDVKDANFAAKNLLKTDTVIGCHFDTFPVIEINHQEANRLFNETEVKLILPKVGEKINF